MRIFFGGMRKFWASVLALMASMGVQLNSNYGRQQGSKFVTLIRKPQLLLCAPKK